MTDDQPQAPIQTELFDGGERMSKFFRSALGLTLPVLAGQFIHLAREIDERMAVLGRSNAPEGSAERLRLAGEIYARRLALCNSQPVTDLDGLMVLFAARQGLAALRELPLDDDHASHREYWHKEIDAALCGVQVLLEWLACYSVEELGFTLNGGTPIN